MNRRTLLQTLAACPLLSWLPGKKPLDVITVQMPADIDLTPVVIDCPSDKTYLDLWEATGAEDHWGLGGDSWLAIGGLGNGHSQYHLTFTKFTRFLNDGLEAKLRALGTALVIQYPALPPPEDLPTVTCKPSDATEKIHMDWWSA